MLPPPHLFGVTHAMPHALALAGSARGPHRNKPRLHGFLLCYASPGQTPGRTRGENSRLGPQHEQPPCLGGRRCAASWRRLDPEHRRYLARASHGCRVAAGRCDWALNWFGMFSKRSTHVMGLLTLTVLRFLAVKNVLRRRTVGTFENHPSMMDCAPASADEGRWRACGHAIPPPVAANGW